MLNLSDLKWRLKDGMSDSPFLMACLSPFFFKSGFRVTPNSQLTIEGYPRSGNTYCVALIYCTVGQDISIARHRHEISQLKSSIRLKIPTSVVIRDPENSISSFVLREGVSLSYAVKLYLKFHYFALENLRDLQILDFTKVVATPEKYAGFLVGGSLYCEAPAKVENLRDAITSKIIAMEQEDSGLNEPRPNHVSLPSEEKNMRKKKVMEILAADFREETAQCKKLYEELVSKAVEL